MTKMVRRDADERTQVPKYRERDVLRAGDTGQSTPLRISLFDTDNSGGLGQFNRRGRTALVCKSSEEGADELIGQA